MDKSISVIIPVIEDNTYLVRCLNTLRRQTISPLEIIIAENNVETKVDCGNNIFCLGDDTSLEPVRVNNALEYSRNDFHDFIFDEERKIAANFNKAISLAKGDFVLFCNVNSVLSPNALKALTNDITIDNYAEITNLYYDGEEYQEIESNGMLWGKVFPRKAVAENKLSKWNCLELLRWTDSVQKGCSRCDLVEKAYVFEESYNELIQKVFTVKLKDDIAKYRKIFMNRLKEGKDLFEGINTYDYVKVNVITSLMEECIKEPNVVIELADRYVLPIFDNRMNAKKNRKALLHEALCKFFQSIEADENQYDIVLILFGLNRKMLDAFKVYDFEMFDKIYQRWMLMGYKEV